MARNEKHIKQARSMIREVLQGTITQETHPWIFDDDLLYFSVRTIEKEDIDWLLSQLAKSEYNERGKLEVTLCILPQNRKKISDPKLRTLHKFPFPNVRKVRNK